MRDLVEDLKTNIASFLFEDSQSLIDSTEWALDAVKFTAWSPEPEATLTDPADILQLRAELKLIAALEEIYVYVYFSQPEKGCFVWHYLELRPRPDSKKIMVFRGQETQIFWDASIPKSYRDLTEYLCNRLAGQEFDY
ncbi:hypothetical protein [Leptolyngbya sp. FACHB-261]|uniref:hypothetical protein n=1 Tax=Leptolyngbya sp. FACHB-261 TaxID=2692806 RepID=UPI00168551E1|nr:hypothetical protein [Leptolyngbya sp. FACHB-261]MBD2100582.1 hypothetical protein [Leptolyngbya sp. FACHB-261]